MTTKKTPVGLPKELSEFDWVRLAASTDEYRPVLSGVCARNGHILATDGHRLHVAPNSGALAHGVWSARGLRKIEGNYPSEDSVNGVANPPVTHRYEVRDLVGLLKLVRAAEAISKVYKSSGSYGRLTLPASDGRAVFCSQYIREILAGAVDLHVTVGLGTSLSPARFELGTDRFAVLMPIRSTPAATDLAIDEFLHELPIPAQEKPKRQRKAKAVA